jgi:hypothetical protein
MKATISIVQSAVATDTRDVDAETMIHAIRDGRWQKPVELIRRVYSETLKSTGDHRAAKVAIDHLKKLLPAVMWERQVFAARK